MTHRILSRLLATVAMLLMLGACASQPDTPSGPRTIVSNPAVTIIVPAQDNPLARALQARLTARGWTLTHYNGPAGSSPAHYAAIARIARYRMTLSSSRVGQCRNGEPSFEYRIAVIENRSGRVPLALSGADCLATVVDQFAGDLDQKALTPRRSSDAATSLPATRETFSKQ